MLGIRQNLTLERFPKARLVDPEERSRSVYVNRRAFDMIIADYAKFLRYAVYRNIPMYLPSQTPRGEVRWSVLKQGSGRVQNVCCLLFGSLNLRFLHRPAIFYARAVNDCDLNFFSLCPRIGFEYC